jgi:hypothetical protein
MNLFRKWCMMGLCLIGISTGLQGQAIEKVEKERKIVPKDVFGIRIAVPNGWWLELDSKGSGELRTPVETNNREFFSFKERSLRFKEVLDALGGGLSATNNAADNVVLIFGLQDGSRLTLYTADVASVRGFFEKCGANVSPKSKADFEAALAKNPYIPEPAVNSVPKGG